MVNREDREKTLQEMLKKPGMLEKIAAALAAPIKSGLNRDPLGKSVEMTEEERIMAKPW